MNRLRKNSQLYDSKYIADKYYEVFKNPTYNETQLIKKINNSVRGTIDVNGNIYIWDGWYFTHFEIINFFPNIPINYFRFSWYPDEFFCDLGGLGANITEEECKNILTHHIDFFKSIGPIEVFGIMGMIDENNKEKNYRGTIQDFLKV